MLLEGKPDWPLGEPVWRETRLQLPEIAGAWRNVYTGERIEADSSGQAWVHTLLGAFPVALLIAEA